MRVFFETVFSYRAALLTGVAVFSLTGCAQGLVPQTRNVNIPPPQTADIREPAVNEKPDSVVYLPLGHDVLVPEAQNVDELPDRQVGPYELRGETLGGALQLILADVDVPIAFQTDLGLTRTVTVTNLKGSLSDVVQQVCSLADLYCAFEKGSLIVKDKQTFTVVLPPIGNTENRTAMMGSVSGAIQAITGMAPITDGSNRTLIYQATSRTADDVNRYFQRMRASTSMIVYETYIWEVTLNNASTAGIKWDALENADRFKFGVSLSGATDPTVGTPISIGLPTTGSVNFTTGDVLDFISKYGAVKTISQPQLTVLSGSTARLRVADTQNYVSQITRTVSGDQTTVSTETDSVDSGFTLEIGSSWDNSTVYGNINILLQEVRDIQTFDDNPEAIVQLPQTTEREVQTQVRVRPGDSVLIAGLVRENDRFNKEGLGVDKPVIPTSRSSGTENAELVFLLKPRVVAFTDSPERYERVPVEGDHAAPPVALRRGDVQAQGISDVDMTSSHDEAGIADDKPKTLKNPKDAGHNKHASMTDEVDHHATQLAAPIPLVNDSPISEPVIEEVLPNQNEKNEHGTVPSTAVRRLFDADNSTRIAPLDQGAPAPLVKKPASKPASVSKTTASNTSKQAKKTTVKSSAPKNKDLTVPDKAALRDIPVSPKAPPKTAGDVAEKILAVPDSSAPSSIPGDLPALTDGTVLPEKMAPLTPPAPVKP